MKTGTNQAILIADLLATDGPYDLLADHFVAGMCSHCRVTGHDQIRFVDAAYLCEECTSQALR